MSQVSEVVKHILYKSREKNTPLTEIMAFFIAQTILNESTTCPIARNRTILLGGQALGIRDERAEETGREEGAG
jgi:hypothetical protein